MFPPVYALAAASSTVQGLLGTEPRLYPFGDAPQGVQLPYVSWQTIGGSPENFLATVPDADRYTIQMDVYGMDAASVRAVAEALRDIYEPTAYITRWGGESKDAQTKHYRYSFDVEFIVNR